jgi:hypothetical protein
VVLGGGGRRNSGEGRRRGQSGTGAGWPRGAPDSFWEGGTGGEAAGDGHRRRTQLVAAGALALARLGLGQWFGRLGQLW